MTSGTETEARDVAGFLARRRADVDRELERLLPSGEEWPTNLHRAIRHSVFAGGKRLRPILCLAAGEVLGARTEDLIAPACGLEMIHTYSLIHDDLPALDNDDLRRGVPTCHVVFGEATAILAGDSLLTHGLGIFASHPKGERFAAAKVRVLETVVEAIGTKGMIGGQAADLEAEKETAPTAELVAKIHENKTGRLIRASLLVGAILAGADEKTLSARGPLRRADRPGLPDQGRPPRRRVGRRDPREGVGKGRGGGQGDVSRASGASKSPGSYWPRTFPRPSRPSRRSPAAVAFSRTSRASSVIGRHETEDRTCGAIPRDRRSRPALGRFSLR